MSSVRRILAVGLPAAGATVLAALALGGAPALAAGSAAGDMARPVVMVTPTSGGYGDTAPATVAPTTATPAPVHTRGQAGYGSHTQGGGAAPATTTPAPAHTRGGQTGYGGVSPTTAPTSPVPTGNTDTVPPGGVSPTTATPTPNETYPGGVSAGHALPLTGPSTGAVVGVGSLMVAAGAAAVWYTRRRRNA